MEAIVEDEDSKSELMTKVSESVEDDVILATSTLRLDIAKIFATVTNQNRCLGIRKVVGKKVRCIMNIYFFFMS